MLVGRGFVLFRLLFLHFYCLIIFLFKQSINRLVHQSKNLKRILLYSLVVKRTGFLSKNLGIYKIVTGHQPNNTENALSFLQLQQYALILSQPNKLTIRSTKNPSISASNQLSQNLLISNGFSSTQSKQFVEYFYLDEPHCKLGQGSYGAVYKCYTKQNNKVYRFAVKVIRVPEYNGSVTSGEDIIQTTRQEIKTLMKFKDNPNIIKIQDLIRYDKIIYLILEYCNDKDIISYFKKLRGEHDQNEQEKPAYNKSKIDSIETINSFMAQLLNGFKALDSSFICHRDFKPGNILVNDGQLKIADFGQSKPLYYKGQTMTESVGTQCTKAPQIRFKQDYTYKCDIYSLGAVYYWMIYKKYPYKDNLTKEEYLKWKVEFTDVGWDGWIVTDEVKNLIRAMMEYEESNRPEWTDLFSHKFFAKSMSVKNNSSNQSKSRLSFDRGMTMIQSEDFNQQIPQEFYKYVSQNDIELNRISVDQYQDFIIIMRSVSWFNLKISFFKEIMRQLSIYTAKEDSETQIQEETLCEVILLGIQKYTIVLNKELQTQLTFKDIPQILDGHALKSLQNQQQFNMYSKDLIQQIHTFEQSQQKPKLSKDKISRLIQKCRQYKIKEEFQNILRDPKQGFDKQITLNEISKVIIELFFLLKPEIKNFNFKKKQLKTSNQENRFKYLVLLVHHLNMFVMHRGIFPNKSNTVIGSQSHEIMGTNDFLKREKFQDREAFMVLANEVLFLLDRFEE